MVHILDSLLAPFRRTRVRPTDTVGVPGTAIYGGLVQDVELSSTLKGIERYKTFSELLANVSVVAAGTRYFLNLVAKAAWSFEPADADTDGRFAELAEEYLMEDPLTPWSRIVRRAAMYRFYGFSVQEWTARRREDGGLTFDDVAPRAQFTIERWDVDPVGRVLGVLQRGPQSGAEFYIPRSKVLYIVDDTLSDSPEGLGLFRHMVEPAKRLQRYEQLEGWGFETDLRGIPVGRGPFAELQAMVNDGELSVEQRAAMEKPLRDFIQNHIRGPKLGLLLDSITYVTTDEAQRPSSTPKWGMDLLKAPAGTQEEVARAIERLNRELARLIGVEGLLLGGDKVGSLALSRDKSHNLFLIVDGTLGELREAVKSDLLTRLWELNGWPSEMMPKLKTEAMRFRDVEQVTAALRDMALSGAVLAPDDPAIAEVRELLSLSAPPESSVLTAAEDAALVGGQDESDDDESSGS